VQELAERSYGEEAKLTGTESDIPWLQRILDDELLEPSQAWELQSLGLAFGSVLCESLAVDWIMVEDEYGRDPALQYTDTSLILYPLTMISKRVEGSQSIDLQRFHDDLKSQVEELGARVDPLEVVPKKPWWRLFG
jgi:hypothetical protein